MIPKQDIKDAIRRGVNRLGWELHRLSPGNDPQLQLKTFLDSIAVDLVLDVGANQGQFGNMLRSMGYQGRIVSFEPLSTAHARLLAAARGDSRWTVHPRVAIGDSEGSIDINIAGNSLSSSILSILPAHTEAARESAYLSSEKTPIARLDSLASKYMSESDVCLLKIDTQGYEWHVLDGAGETLRGAAAVLCEISFAPLYAGQRLWRDVIDRLDGLGFTLWFLQPEFVDLRDGRLLQADAIFLRRPPP